MSKWPLSGTTYELRVMGYGCFGFWAKKMELFVELLFDGFRYTSSINNVATPYLPIAINEVYLYTQ